MGFVHAYLKRDSGVKETVVQLPSHAYTFCEEYDVCALHSKCGHAFLAFLESNHDLVFLYSHQYSIGRERGKRSNIPKSPPSLPLSLPLSFFDLAGVITMWYELIALLIIRRKIKRNTIPLRTQSNTLKREKNPVKMREPLARASGHAKTWGYEQLR